MFKKGQLLRSKLSGRLYEVLSWPQVLVAKDGERFRLTHSEVELIGNNYQPRPPKTKE